MPMHSRTAWTESSDEEDDHFLSAIRMARTEEKLQQIDTEQHAHRMFTAHASRRPLIDRVTNEWKTGSHFDYAETHTKRYEEEDEMGFCDLDDPTSCPNITTDTLTSRTFWVGSLIWIGLALVVFGGWKSYVQPILTEHQEYAQGFSLMQQHTTYGIARGGSFDGTRLRHLASELVPGGRTDPHRERRLVFIGDIHGCADELSALMKRIGFNARKDHVIATGDVISKGPDNPGVLDFLIRNKASCVRGNHEDRILIAAKAMSASHKGTEEDVDIVSHKGAAKDSKLLKKLSKKHLEYLADMPLMLQIPALPATNGLASKARNRKHHITESIVVVHAGLVPAVALTKQDPYFVMNMRTINRRTHVPSAERTRGVPWYQLWNWYQTRLSSVEHSFMTWLYNAVVGTSIDFSPLLPASQDEDTDSLKPFVVVYGHDSKAGLQDHRWSKGLDTGCVGGGHLTALVLDATGKVELVSVSCKGYI